MLIGNKTRLNPRSPNRPSKTRRGAADLGFSPHLISNNILLTSLGNPFSWFRARGPGSILDICPGCVSVASAHTSSSGTARREGQRWSKTMQCWWMFPQLRGTRSSTELHDECPSVAACSYAVHCQVTRCSAARCHANQFRANQLQFLFCKWN